MVPGSLTNVALGVFPGRWSHAQLYKMLPNTPVISRLAVHDEILPNPLYQLSSDVSNGRD